MVGLILGLVALQSCSESENKGDSPIPRDRSFKITNVTDIIPNEILVDTLYGWNDTTNSLSYIAFKLKDKETGNSIPFQTFVNAMVAANDTGNTFVIDSASLSLDMPIIKKYKFKGISVYDTLIDPPFKMINRDGEAWFVSVSDYKELSNKYGKQPDETNNSTYGIGFTIPIVYPGQPCPGGTKLCPVWNCYLFGQVCIRVLFCICPIAEVNIEIGSTSAPGTGFGI